MARRTTILPLMAALLAAIGTGAVLSEQPAVAAASDASACTVQYAATADKTLLFGGVLGGCTKGCQPRSNRWSQSCDVTKVAQAPEEAKYLGYPCQPYQTAAVLAQLKQQPDFAVLQQFSPCALHRLLQGRTLWVIGDSFMRNTYFALRCFMLDFWDHSLGECAVSPSRRLQKAIYQAADTNMTSARGSRVITDVPLCVHLLQGGRICWVHSVRGEEFADTSVLSPGLLQVLQRTAAKSDDVFFLNFGRWHFDNCRGLEEEPYTRALLQLGQLYASTKAAFPNVIFKVPAHDHTACGEDGQRLELDQCAPAGQGNYSLAVGRSLTTAAIDILTRYGLPVLDTYDLTLALHMAHNGRDCNHYCSPGVPEAEIFAMYRLLWRQGLKPLSSSSSSSSSSNAAGTGGSGTAAAVHECVAVVDMRIPPAGWSAHYDSLQRKRTSRRPFAAEADLY